MPGNEPSVILLAKNLTLDWAEWLSPWIPVLAAFADAALVLVVGEVSNMGHVAAEIERTSDDVTQPGVTAALVATLSAGVGMTSTRPPAPVGPSLRVRFRSLYCRSVIESAYLARGAA